MKPRDAHDLAEGVSREHVEVPTTRSKFIGTLKLAFAAAILVYLFNVVPFSTVRGALELADLSWIAAALLLDLIAQMIVAMRLRILTDAYTLSLTTFDVFKINMATRFYGLFLPGGGVTATVVRVLKLGRLRENYGGAIASIALDRVIATEALCFVGVVFGLVVWRPGQSGWLLIMGLTIPALAAPFWFLTRSKRFTASSRLLASFRAIEPMGRIAAAIAHIPRNKWTRILGLSLLAHVLGAVQYLTLAHSLNVELGFAALGWIRSVMLFAALVPITISGLGLREGAAVLIFPAYGVGADVALAFSLLVFAVSHVALGLVGGLLEGLSQRRLFKRIP